MRAKISILLILFLCQESLSQEEKWSFYDLDSIVSLTMPFVVYEIDTIINYSKFYEIYSDGNSSQFIAQKLYFGKLYSNIETPILPKNEKSLNKYYLDLIGILDEMSEYKLDSRKPVQKNNINGYKLIYSNVDNIQVQETNLFFVNKNLYSFSYINKNGLNEIDKITFFNSITFDNEKQLLQYPIQSISLKKKVLLTLFAILFLSFIFRFISKRKSI